MPDMTIEIGGRAFTVACQDGEETYLRSAAEMLDREAQVLLRGGGRLTQDRMLLMAGLMLADKAISAEEELRALDRRLAQQTQALDDLQPGSESDVKVREVEKTVEVVPDAALERLDKIVARAEEVAVEARNLT